MRQATMMLLGFAALHVPLGSVLADTLDEVRARSRLHCGVNEGLAGFSISDERGHWTGIDVDLCRAVAAAVIGRADAVTYVPLTARDRFAALRAGEIDLLARNTTWTFSRDNDEAVNFAGVNFFDGQGFMTRDSSGYASVTDLDGASICVTQHTTTELNLNDYFRGRAMRFEAMPFIRLPEMYAAYDAGVCDVITADQSSLAANRPQLSEPARHVILPETISKEPLGPAVRQGDDRWLDVVRWTLFAMIAAEEYGVDSKNVQRVRAGSSRPAVKRLLGVEGQFGAKLDLPADWAFQILLQVGNYAESFDRNVGKASPIRLPRGLNALWTEGGLLYAMPFR